MYYKVPDISNTSGFALHFLDDGVDQKTVPNFPQHAVPITDAAAAAIRAAQNVLTPAQIEDNFTASIQQRLDNFARTRNYDSILSACTYATSTVPQFQTEGQACVNLRDATWGAAYAILTAVQNGNRPMPASLQEIEKDLPTLVWP